MKRLVTAAAIFVAFGFWMNRAHAVTAPLAFGVTGDSNGTPSTVAYRDVSGNASFNYIQLASPTTTQLSVLSPNAANEQVTVLMINGGIGVCYSTGTTPGAWVYPSTSSTASLRPCN